MIEFSSVINDRRRVDRPARHSHLIRLLDLLLLWQDRIQERHKLASLSDWELKDIGLTRDLIQRETEKAFWIK